uniref:Uncharacterized protein n=1 Tax=Globodera rostochiensis TaxID=31243 RepID=A0A914IDF0_GLORO
MSSPVRQIKCVVVGDGTVGKTCMLISYTTDSFPRNTSQRCLTIIQPLSPWTVIPVVSPVSFDNVITKWIPEIRQYCTESIPIILVGTKIDLRDDPATLRSLQSEKRSPVTKAQGQKVAARIKAYKYCECSALTQQGLSAVFEEAVRAVISPKPKKKRKCSIL